MQRLAIAAFVGAACADHHKSKGEHHNELKSGHKGEHKKGDHHGHHAQKDVDVKMLEEIVGGILKGAIDAEGFTDINSCIKDAETVFADAKLAIDDFKKKDVSDVIAGIKEVAELMKVVKNGMQDCSSIKADWEKLVKMISIFDSPTSFAYHVGKDLMVNGVQIYEEITTAVSDYEQAKWGDFGYQIGQAAAKTLLGEEQLPIFATQDSKIKEAEIMQGILSAFGGNFDLYALLECIYEEDQAALMFDVAVQSFVQAVEKKDPSEAIGGVIAVIAGVEQFKKGLPACEAINPKKDRDFNFKQFNQVMDVAVHPSQFFKVSQNDLLVNNHGIMKEAAEAVEAYQDEKYFEFGQIMGKILEISTGVKIEAAPVVPALEIVQNPDAAAVDRQMIAEFAQGFLETSQVGEFNFTNLLICIYEADQAALILYQAVEILEEAYHNKDMNEAIGGIIASVAFLAQLKQSIPVCESVAQTQQDWTHFDHIIETLEDPKDHMALIEKDIVMNGVTITADLGDALEAFRAGDFRLFGRSLGKVLYIATEGNPADLFLY